MNPLRQPALLCLLALAAAHPLVAQSTATPPPAAKPAEAKPVPTKPSVILDKSFPVPAKPASKPVAKPASTAPKPTPKPTLTPTTSTTTLNRNVILLDPAHGGVDSGARISDTLLEKSVTLTLAFKLRSLLAARGFSVQLTRDSDNPVEPADQGSPLTLDDRAGIANHTRPVACILLHATASGTGVHLYNSQLDPVSAESIPQPWLTAQAPWVDQSQSLQRLLADALNRAHIPLVVSAASVRPLDSLTCPAIVLELAPANGDDANSISDLTYQQHIAEAIATSLVFWKTQAMPPVQATAPHPSDPAESQP